MTSKERERELTRDENKLKNSSKRTKTKTSNKEDFGFTSDENDQTINFDDVSDEEVEKAQDRLKAAKKYLNSITQDAKKSKKNKFDESNGSNGSDGEDRNDENELPFGEIDAEEIDREIIASRLQRDTLISRGRAFEALAQSYSQNDKEIITVSCNTADGRVPTGCAFAPNRIVYMITKGNCVYQYRYSSELPCKLIKLHTFRGTGDAAKIDSFCSVSVSSCGGYLVAGSHSGKIVVWNIKAKSKSKNSNNSKTTNNNNSPETELNFTYKQQTVLSQHRGPVLAIAFSRDNLTFYSSSTDRTVKIWSIESGEALYIDTLYGHQDSVASLAALGKESCVTVGSRDRTARLWKIAEETQLVFRGPESSGGSQEVITLLEEGAFLTGTDLGAISLWNTRRKKPLRTVNNSHMGNHSIGALAALSFTDLVASGAGDGFIRLWRAAPSSGELICIREIPCKGFVTSLAWNEDGSALAIGVGKEPRLGRWEIQKAAKNQLHVLLFNNITKTN